MKGNYHISHILFTLSTISRDGYESQERFLWILCILGIREERGLAKNTLKILNDLIGRGLKRLLLIISTKENVSRFNEETGSN
ncbi:hypothetical protein [Thermodesulfovibrio thiophilus]|uniref:hypothetical protein n=1 Tax=Thermodesulfovibrio thiophilus TaxID=340095 RepID=UPI00048C91C8|nr:hypothetical protein [Thermodesulfovibrio thiophilus]